MVASSSRCSIPQKRSSSRPERRSKVFIPSGRTPIWAFAAAGSAQTSWPSTSTRPASGRSSPVTIERVVVLPAPLGPTKPNIDPRGTHMVRLSTATLGPNRLVSPSIMTAGWPGGRVSAGTETAACGMVRDPVGPSLILLITSSQRASLTGHPQKKSESFITVSLYPIQLV